MMLGMKHYCVTSCPVYFYCLCLSIRLMRVVVTDQLTVRLVKVGYVDYKFTIQATEFAYKHI